MATNTKRLPRQLLAALRASGLPWKIEDGARHKHIRLNGRLVGILPRSYDESSGKALRNTLAQIKRLTRDHKGNRST